jgi:hypothetical protein
MTFLIHLESCLELNEVISTMQFRQDISQLIVGIDLLSVDMHYVRNSNMRQIRDTCKSNHL